jgi:alpha-tubulin suppressor-like RCC1 family protein
VLADGMTVSCSGGRAAPAAFVAGITRIGLGAAHSCALASGTVWCWGNNGRGQVGTWDLRAALPPTSTGRSSSDTGAVAYSEIAVGRWHTCGRRTDGSVWCWGDNALSQLGRVTTLAYDYMPGEVRLSGARMDATTLATGRDHTCAGLRDGRVVCWGSNAEGQLGRWVPGLMTTEPVEPEGFWIE